MPIFPCSADLVFYQSKRTPAWAARIQTPTRTSIDNVVNAHGDTQRVTSGECAAMNLLAIARGYIRSGKDLEQELRRISNNPECAISPEKRRAFARKWANRLRPV